MLRLVQTGLVHGEFKIALGELFVETLLQVLDTRAGAALIDEARKDRASHRLSRRLLRHNQPVAEDVPGDQERDGDEENAGAVAAHVPGKDQCAGGDFARGELKQTLGVGIAYVDQGADHDGVRQKPAHEGEEAGDREDIGLKWRVADGQADDEQGQQQEQWIAGADPSPGAGVIGKTQRELARVEQQDRAQHRHQKRGDIRTGAFRQHVRIDASPGCDAMAEGSVEGIGDERDQR